MDKAASRLILGILALTLISTSLVRSQSAPSADRTIIIQAARLFDGSSDTLKAPGVIVVSAGKIVAVGSAPSLPADAQTIDLGDATLLPGFMDAHTHLTMEFTDDWNRDLVAGLQKSSGGNGS
jgi:imidazolonepropionase-like amidohydrolase